MGRSQQSLYRIWDTSARTGYGRAATFSDTIGQADTFENDVYCHDPAAVPYTAQYPLTAYDPAEGLVYYSFKGERG